MDFFASQEKARRSTFWLVVLYFSTVAAIILAVYGALVGAVFLTEVFAESREWHGVYRGLIDTQAFLVIICGTVIVVLCGTIVKFIALGRGGAAVTEALGGRLIPTNTLDLHERRLLNVIEEMALASGTPVPPVYLLTEEEGINAFAAGFAPSDAVIGVTRGCMRRLTRDELQGVMAHEFSHILNGDMRLNLRLIAVLNGILAIALIGRVLLDLSGRSSRGSKKGDGRAIAFFAGAGLFLVGGIGVLGARIIKSALARQREYLADASAVQFTRNPSGISGALKKIGGLSAGSAVAAPRAEEASHMFFSQGLRSSLFATHPPLLERIKRIEPSFEGVFPRCPDEEPAKDEEAAPLSRAAAVAATPRAIVEAVGTVTPAHLDYAAALVSGLPAALRDRAREPYGARAVVFSLLLSTGKEQQTAQLDALSRCIDQNTLQELLRIVPETAALARADRLPLIDLALPALKALSRQQREEFGAAIDVLINADQRCSLWEYTVRRIVNRHLLHKSARENSRYASVEALRPQALLVLSSLAHSGTAGAPAAEDAFRRGAAELRLNNAPPLLERSSCSLDAVDGALTELAFASPGIKRLLISAFAAVVITDGQMSPAEAELLRAAAEALECPIPPFLG